MLAHALDWLGLLVRWFHLIAGIGWIGSSFYFMWLDSALEPPKVAKPGVESELWMVHSGGFYQVEKRLITPGSMPAVLHWFKWEALFTWISGIFLLGLVYYIAGGVFLIDASRSNLSVAAAIGLSLGVIAISWFIYDALWTSGLADTKPKVATGLSFLLLLFIVFGLCHVFSGRAAFIHVGAVLGTIMVANVWRRILPAQQQMINATKAGEKPDYSLGLRAKRRSVHNSYVTLPVVFMMISNHYPALYGHGQNWIVLTLMIFLGAMVRHAMILESKAKPFWPWLIAVGVTLGVLIGVTAKSRGDSLTSPSSVSGTTVSDAVALSLVRTHCMGCHSTEPTDELFSAAPNGVVLDSLAQVRAHADGIQLRVIETQTMPLGNKTDMTIEERQILGQWLRQP